MESVIFVPMIGISHKPIYFPSSSAELAQYISPLFLMHSLATICWIMPTLPFSTWLLVSMARLNVFTLEWFERCKFKHFTSLRANGPVFIPHMYHSLQKRFVKKWFFKRSLLITNQNTQVHQTIFFMRHQACHCCSDIRIWCSAK